MALDELPSRELSVFVVLNAWRSAATLRRFQENQPKVPCVVLLTGTDIFPNIAAHPEALESLRRATAIVSWHREIELPAEFHAKWQVIPKSVPDAPPWLATPGDSRRVMVLAHLRRVKDPFCAAQALTQLPKTSHISVELVGQEREDGFAEQAKAWERRTPHFAWLGGIDRAAIWEKLRTTWLTINSSELEGGANAVLESVAIGVPVLASAISGNYGLLGRDYAGYFPAGNPTALAALLTHCETDPTFYETLRQQILALRTKLSAATEQSGWKDLVKRLAGG